MLHFRVNILFVCYNFLVAINLEETIIIANAIIYYVVAINLADTVILSQATFIENSKFSLIVFSIVFSKC